MRIQRKHQSIFFGFLLELVILLTVGCGSSNHDTVFIGQQAPGGTGSLVFQFAQAQALTVPGDTQTLRFDLYTRADDTGTLLLALTRESRPTVVLEDISTSARSVTITAFGPESVPLGQVTVPVTVVENARTEVDLSNESFDIIIPAGLSLSPETLSLDHDESGSFSSLVTFSDGGSATVSDVVYSDFDTDLVSLDSDGVFTPGNEEGATAVTVSYSFGGVTVSDTALIVVSFVDKSFLGDSKSDTVTLQMGQGFTLELANIIEYVGSRPIYDRSFTASLTAPVDGVSLTQIETGLYKVSVADDAVPGSRAEIRGSYQDGNGVTQNDNFIIVVSSDPGVHPI